MYSDEQNEAAQAAANPLGGLFKGSGLNPIKTSKEMLKNDLARLQKNPTSLGMTEAERTKMIGDATSAANAQQQAQVSQLGQQALAAQPFQAGEFQKAQQGIAGRAEDAAVKASAGVNDLNQRMIQQEADRIRGELDAARERSRENTRFWAQFGLQGVSSLIGAALGNPASALAPAYEAAPAAAPSLATQTAPSFGAAPVIWPGATP